MSANIAAVLAVALAVVGVVLWADAAQRDADLASLDDAEAQVEPEHRVTYFVTASGTANEDVDVTYMDADGSGAQKTLPGIAPVWKDEVTTEPGLPMVSLTASGSSSDLAFTLFCTISVDGVEVAKDSGTFACNARFDFDQLPEAKKSAAAHPTPTATPTTQAPRAATPPACEWVDAAEMSQIVSQAAAVPKYVLGSSGSRTKCQHVIDRDTGTVTYELEKNGQRGGLPAVRVRGIKEPAWWLDYGGQMGELRVNLPKGRVFHVTVYFLGLRADAKGIAVATYERARADVLKK